MRQPRAHPQEIFNPWPCSTTSPNYVWNLSISIAMASGGELGEIMDMCQPLLEKSQAGEDAGTGEFLAEWMKVADKLIGLAAEDVEKGKAAVGRP